MSRPLVILFCLLAMISWSPAITQADETPADTESPTYDLPVDGQWHAMPKRFVGGNAPYWSVNVAYGKGTAKVALDNDSPVYHLTAEADSPKPFHTYNGQKPVNAGPGAKFVLTITAKGKGSLGGSAYLYDADGRAFGLVEDPIVFQKITSETEFQGYVFEFTLPDAVHTRVPAVVRLAIAVEAGSDIMLKNMTATTTVKQPEKKAQASVEPVRTLDLAQKLEQEKDLAEGKAMLKTMAALAQTRKPMVDRPQVFIRSQTKYAGRLYRNHNLWVDRPLFASRELFEDGGSDHTYASFQKNFKLYQDYGLDGYATFAWPREGEYTRTMRPIFETAAQLKLDPDAFHIMLEMASPPAYLNIRDETLKLITDNPYYMKINGKSVISSYVLDNHKPEQLAEYVNKLRERSGDRVAILPQIIFIHLTNPQGRPTNLFAVHEMYRQTGTVPASMLKQMQEYLRSYARVTDGLYIGPRMSEVDTTIDENFTRDILVPVFKSVLAEPEFNGRKIFGMQMVAGYTSYHGTQSRSRDGTKTLRGSLEWIANAKPDLMIGTEWDELNEDTGFEPLLAKPMSSQRIIKYYMSQLKDQTPTPNPGDDLSLPNLIVSQKRQMMLGQTMDVELLNVPDTNQGQPYTVRLELMDQHDTIVFRSEPIAFDTAKLTDKTFKLPSETLPDCQVIQTRLIIDYQGKQRVMDTGLPFTVVHATAAWDQTYFCTPVRNVLTPTEAQVNFALTDDSVAPGVSKVAVTAKLTSPDELAAAEVVQDSLEIFAYDPANEYLQNDAQRQLLKLSWHYINTPYKMNIKFRVDLQHAPSALTFTTPESNTIPMIQVPNVKATAGPAFTQNTHTWKQNEAIDEVSHYESERFISMTRDEMATAVVTIEGERLNGAQKGETFSWTLPLKDLGNYGISSKVFEDGLMFALETQHRPAAPPLPLKSKQISFKHEVMADEPNGVLGLRLVSTTGKVFWSKPFAVNQQPSETTMPVQVFSDEVKKAVTVNVAKNRVPVIRYDFSPRWGNILHTDAGRSYYGHAGGYISTATGFTGLEAASYSIPFALYAAHIFKGADRPAPTWVQQDDGQWSLYFDGERGNFLAFPNTLMPQRAAFTLSFEIKPDEVKPEQVLFANEGSTYGGLNVSVKDGMFEFYYVRRNLGDTSLPVWSRVSFTTNIPMIQGKWQKVTLSYDQSEIKLTANGKTQAFPLEGVGLYLQLSGFGGRGDRTAAGVIPFFKGNLRAFEVQHHVNSEVDLTTSAVSSR